MAKIVEILKTDDPRDVIHEVVQALAEGHLIGLPTETLYTVAAYAPSAAAATRLAELAQDLEIDDCVLAVRGAQEALDYLPSLSPLGQKLLRRFWPGPVTLRFPVEQPPGLVRSLPEPTRRALLSKNSLALRMPGGDVAGAILRLLPGPLLLLGETTKTGRGFATAEALSEACGDRLASLIDAGPGKYPVPTSVVSISPEGWNLNREGIATARSLNRLAGTLFLFVCTGNTCRSPMAEALFRKLLAERLNCSEDDLLDRGFFAASAGVSAAAGSPPATDAIEVLKVRGVDLRGHESQPVTPQLLSQADRIFTMTRSHRECLLREFPEVAARVDLLAADGSDIIDPIGAGLDEYRRCADEIERHLRSVLDDISGN